MAVATQASLEHLEGARAAFQSGHWQTAEIACRQFLRAHPSDPDGLHLLGRVLHSTGQTAMAIALFRKVLAADPDNASVLASLGGAYLTLCRYADAMTSLARAIQMDPSATRARKLLGLALREQGRTADAVDQLRRVLQLRPDDVSGHVQLGSALADLGEREAALATFARAAELDPNAADAHLKIGNLLMDKGQVPAATERFRRAVELAPELPYVHSNLLFSLHYGLKHDRRALRAEAERWAARHAPMRPAPPPPRVDRAAPDRPLRIGYVSADFRSHPVGYFMKSVLGAHDPSSFEVFCYSNAVRADRMTQQLAPLAQHWRNIAVADDAEIASAIQRDEIDILVDLSGHTGGHRLSVFGRRAAPVQVTWLGYSGTTGVAAMDYVLVDDVVCPAGHEDQFTETPIRLPNSYLCYSPPDDVPSVSALPALERGYVTFGCFNRVAKIGPEVIHLWAEILRRLPEARLLLKDAAFDEEDVAEHFREAFEQHGVASHRVELLGRSARNDDHFRAYGQVDIALDPFPFNGATTTADALCMGVPVVTLAGDRFIARMGASLLTACGLSDFVADSGDTYVRIATDAASDPVRLAALRPRLREQVLASPLCNGVSFTRDLERAYRRMWHTLCAHEQRSGEKW